MRKLCTKKLITGTCTALLLLFANSPTFAKNELDGVRPTWLIGFHGGPSTYKSDMVVSNDTGYSYGYTLGFHAGQRRTLGILIRSDSNTTTFALNESKIQSTWQDTIIRYYWGVLHFGAILTQGSIIANKQGSEYIDVIGWGYGGNIGFTFPIHRLGVWFLEYRTASLSTVRELNKTDVTVGSRSDIDLGAIFKITKKFFDFTLGYKQRTTPVTVDTTYNEILMTTYVGFRFNVFF